MFLYEAFFLSFFFLPSFLYALPVLRSHTLFNYHVIALQIQADQVDGALSACSSVVVPQFDHDHDQQLHPLPLFASFLIPIH